MILEIPMATIECCHCGHKMWIAHIYDEAYYKSQVCSECGELYIVPKEVPTEVTPIIEEGSSDGEPETETNH